MEDKFNKVGAALNAVVLFQLRARKRMKGKKVARIKNAKNAKKGGVKGQDSDGDLEENPPEEIWTDVSALRRLPDLETEN